MIVEANHYDARIMINHVLIITFTYVGVVENYLQSIQNPNTIFKTHIRGNENVYLHVMLHSLELMSCLEM